MVGCDVASVDCPRNWNALCATVGTSGSTIRCHMGRDGQTGQKHAILRCVELFRGLHRHACRHLRRRSSQCIRFWISGSCGADRRDASCAVRHPLRGRPVVAQSRPAPRPTSPAPAARSLGSKIDEATFALIKPTAGEICLGECLEGHRLAVATSYFWLCAEAHFLECPLNGR